MAQHDKEARVPLRFSTALLAAAATSESFFGKKWDSFTCFARSKRFMASRAEAPLQSHPTLPSDTQGPCGCPGGAFYKKNSCRNTKSRQCLCDGLQSRVCYKYCQHLLRGFTLLDLANTNKHLRAELAHRALAFGLLTNELPTVQPFNFIKLPRRFQLKAWVKWHTAVFQRPHREKAHSSV